VQPTRQRHRRYRLLIGVLGAALLVISATACGSDAGPDSQESTGSRNVTPSAEVFTFDDLAAIGFKEQKEYDVEGLTAATGAWFGWWRPGGDEPLDYEVRFYRSHEDAVEFGTSFAEEASGEDAVINSNDATWKEDVRERRAIFVANKAGGAGSQGGFGAGPKYRDYAIFANMVLLCEGSTSEHSLERCKALIEALVGAAEE